MLLRLVELDGGSVHLGGRSLRDLDLFAVRRAVAMIPQEPFLIQGTVRQNLDPFGERSEAEIASALQQVGLKYSLVRPSDRQRCKSISGGASASLVFENS